MKSILSLSAAAILSLSSLVASADHLTVSGQSAVSLPAISANASGAITLHNPFATQPQPAPQVVVSQPQPAPQVVVLQPAPAPTVVSQPAPSAPEVVVASAPPPVVTETCPRQVQNNTTWVGGHWRWNGARHVWIAGHWATRPHQQASWQPAQWVRQFDGRWAYRPGHWVFHRPTVAPQPVPVIAQQPQPRYVATQPGTFIRVSYPAHRNYGSHVIVQPSSYGYRRPL